MFNFLSKKFVKDYTNYQDSHVRLELISLSGIIGIAVNFILFFIKIILGIISKSSSILADAFNNMADALSSTITFVGAKASMKPADKMHPWGHGRSEYLASFIVGLLIMLLALSLLRSSVVSFFEAKIPKINTLSLIILGLSMILKIYIYILNSNLAKKIDSDLNLAVKMDARNDIISTCSIIVALFLQKYVSFNIDALLGIGLSVLVFIPGLELYNENVNRLLGKRVGKDIEEKIGDIIVSGDFVVGYHNLQIHEYGKGILVGSCDVEVPANISVGIMHESISYVEDKLRENLNVDITLHMDPTYCIINNKKNEEKLEKLGQRRKYGYKDLQNK